MKAIEIDAVGEKDFADVPRTTTKKRSFQIPVDEDTNTLPNLASNISNPGNDVGDKDNDVDENSGFCQPIKLAKFVKDRSTAIDNNSTSICKTNDALDEKTEEQEKERDMVEVCGRQICRTWLKFAYLDNGNPCSDSNCLRKHAITCKPEHLYKDYSFKGLNQKQRKRIIDKLATELNK